jgi:hypothetical protein
VRVSIATMVCPRITAATRERFGYYAWRVKRCLMKQGYEVNASRVDYGYRDWLVRAAVEGKSTPNDQIDNRTKTPVDPPSPTASCTKPRKAQAKQAAKKETKPEGFWAPCNSHDRIQAACSRDQLACLRQISPRAKVTKERYSERMKPARFFDPCPASVVSSSLNQGIEFVCRVSSEVFHLGFRGLCLLFRVYTCVDPKP